MKERKKERTNYGKKRKKEKIELLFTLHQLWVNLRCLSMFKFSQLNATHRLFLHVHTVLRPIIKEILFKRIRLLNPIHTVPF